MRFQIFVFSTAALAISLVARARAADVTVPPKTISTAISKSIPLLERAMAGSADKRKCFTCHNQAAPILALVEARKHGFAIDAENLQRQLQHTADHLQRGRKNYLDGRGQGGKVLTAGYALWALDAGGRQPDENTAAVTGFLLAYQKKDDHWSHAGSRPPSSGSDFTATFVALRGLAAFGAGEQRPAIDDRTKVVSKWLNATAPKGTEDRVFRLRSLGYVGADTDNVGKAVADLMDRQRSDGGWAQKGDMQSDAYATGTAIAALLDTGELSKDHAAVHRAVRYLVDYQQEDGSWHVVTRAKAFQTYFESGFPHGKDQFISVAASSWATLGLLLALPEETGADDKD